MKTCVDCGKEKPLGEFYKRTDSPDGHRNQCKKCKVAQNVAVNRASPNRTAYLRAWAESEDRAETERERRKAKYAADPEKSAAQVTAWQAANPEKRRAHTAVARALKKGVLVRPERCPSCKRPVKPQAHHPDYNRPLDVEWLCARCHQRAHRKD